MLYIEIDRTGTSSLVMCLLSVLDIVVSKETGFANRRADVVRSRIDDQIEKSPYNISTSSNKWKSRIKKID